MISNLTFRLAMESDLPEIMRLIKSDLLTRESERSMDPMPDCYLQAFRAIDASPDNELIVACLEDAVVGCLQITYIPYLANYADCALRLRLFEWIPDCAAVELAAK